MVAAEVGTEADCMVLFVFQTTTTVYLQIAYCIRGHLHHKSNVSDHDVVENVKET